MENTKEIQTKAIEVIFVGDRRFKLVENLLNKTFREKSCKRASKDCRVRSSMENFKRNFTAREQGRIFASKREISTSVIKREFFLCTSREGGSF